MSNKPQYIGTHLITCACVRAAPDGEWIGNPALCDCKQVCSDETHKGYGLTGCLDCADEIADEYQHADLNNPKFSGTWTTLVQTKGKEKTMSTTKDSKRILSVTVIRDVDTDPDTSWLGEYANSPTSEYSIDRAHSEDCQSITSNAVIETLDNAISYLNIGHNVKDIEEWEAIREAQDILVEKQEELGECDCNERGDMNRGEYRYFNPSFNYVDSKGNLVDGNTPDDVRKYVRQDYERMGSLSRGNWCFIGIRAEASVIVRNESVRGRSVGLEQTISSGGLWGIESDSGEAYIAEVETEELNELRAQLHAIGFSRRAITAAFRNVERKDT